MTYAALVATVATVHSLKRRRAKRIVETALMLMAESAWKDGGFVMPHLGRFYVRRRKARAIGAPPGSQRPGEVITLPASEELGFRASKYQKRGARQ
jgi:nucleoid DNA-binding protein